MKLNCFLYSVANPSASARDTRRPCPTRPLAVCAIRQFLLVLALVSFCGSVQPLRAQDLGLPPWANCEIRRENQKVVLRWLTKEGAPYQIESCSAIGTPWTNHGPVCAGNGAWMSMTIPTAEEGAGFFRIQDLSVAAESSGAVTAFFIPGQGLLTVTGTSDDNDIAISRDAAGRILVAGGAVAIKGGTPFVGNTVLITVFGMNGNDKLTLDEANGALPKAQLFGGIGNDVLTGGSGADLLLGQSGADTLFGKGGADMLFGGDDNDSLTGGDADDSVFGESGNDRMIWNPGDDTDLVEGGADSDTVEVNGGNAAEEFATTANGARVRFDRIDPAPFSLDIGTSEQLVLNANGGNDHFSATGNLASLIRITVDGGAGNDTLLGSNGPDLFLGGDGDDLVDGQQGNDVAFLEAGNDAFQWDPGDGSDTIEGQDGADTLRFNGSAAAELFEAFAMGARVRFTRNIGSIVMDLDDVEQIDLAAGAGSDTTTIHNLSGTDVLTANVSLAGTIGGSTVDGQPDKVIVVGSNGNDLVEVLGSGTAYSVVGLPTLVSVSQSEGTNDTLVVNALGGNDGLTAATLPAGVVKLTFDGGVGNDNLVGSSGADVLLGGDNDDILDGRRGDDMAFMGAGDDTFRWNPGDGSDLLEGQDGFDTMVFAGSAVAEIFDFSAIGTRLRFSRNVANIVMDCDGLEQVQCNVLGGADSIFINNLAGTDVTEINLKLSDANGLGDLQADTVTIAGTGTNDVAFVHGSAAGVQVFGLTAVVTLNGTEAANDRLVFNLLAGDDVLEASDLSAGALRLTGNGGANDDVLVGSDGNDTLSGGDGDDVLLGGPGLDIFDGGPGDNIVIQD